MRTKASLLIIVCLSLMAQAMSQTDSIPAGPKAKVGIFVPLYLDSLFNEAGVYKNGNNLPKVVIPGLEFYSGVQLALDSLQAEKMNVEVFIVDTKKRGRSLSETIENDLKGASLFIGMVQNVPELKLLSEAAHQRNIPFISATYPNDGGTTANPSLIIINATLKSHCQGIYKLLRSSYAKENIIVLSKPGVQEEKIRTVLDESNRSSGAPIKWKTGDVSNGMTVEELTALMDSTKRNVIVCATLDEGIGNGLISTASSLKGTYTTTVIGMPTWDDQKFDKPEYKGVEIMYSTPFLTSSGNAKVYNSISGKFKARAHSRPSDMVFKGFEITYRYIKNMLSHQDNVIDLSDRAGKIFSDFDIQPVKSKNPKNEPDLYENKKVYFIKKVDGAIKGIL